MTEPKSANDLKGKQGLRRLINATRYSMQGIRAALQHEAAFREEFFLALLLIPLALLLPISVLERSCSLSPRFSFLLLKSSIQRSKPASIGWAMKYIRLQDAPRTWAAPPSFSHLSWLALHGFSLPVRLSLSTFCDDEASPVDFFQALIRARPRSRLESLHQLYSSLHST
mgnify:CR=1 FL=1